MKSQNKFHHNPITNVTIGTIVYGITAFVCVCATAILIDAFTNGASVSFGIYN